MKKRFDFVDVTLRDAHQCLWSTRMTTAMMLPVAPILDRLCPAMNERRIVPGLPGVTHF